MVLSDVTPAAQESETADSPDRQSLYGLITTRAARLRPRVLAAMVAIGVGGSAAVLLIGLRYWAYAFVFVSLATIGAWGLIEQRAQQPHTRVVAAAEWLLAGIGILVGCASLIGLWFSLLGDSPIS